MSDLKDSDGNTIWSNNTYKIRFADGSELGISSGTNAGVVGPSGLGLVVKYGYTKAFSGDDGWPEEHVGYLKAEYISGNPISKKAGYLSLSSTDNSTLTWYDTNDSYGFTSKNLTGSRVLLYAVSSSERVQGLRLVPDTSAGYKLMNDSLMNNGLECQFVKV